MDKGHARHVAELADRIFDQTFSLHNLEPEYRILLDAAAYLHDIGHFINTIDHDKHGYCILDANPITGLTEAQQATVANQVRFHRRQLPGLDENGFHSLLQDDRLTLIKLLSILRIADGLDTNRSGRVKDVCLENTMAAWVLKFGGDGGLLFEKWTADKRKNLFCGLFGVTLEI